MFTSRVVQRNNLLMSEKSIIQEILIKCSKFGSTLFRNNTAMAWAGKFKCRLENGDVVISNAIPLHAGLCKGSSDLIGWTKVKITEEMIGKQYAIFTAIEVKYGKTKNTPEQENFIKIIKSHGGIAGFVRDFEEFKQTLDLKDQTIH